MANYTRITTFTAAALGVIATATVTAAVSNSFFTRGDIIYDTTGRTDSPSIIVDTESMSTMVVETCTSTGASSNHRTCSFTNPRSGSGLLMDLFIEATGVGTATTMDCSYGLAAGITTSATGTTAVPGFQNRTFATGSVLHNLSGSILIRNSTIINCATTADPGTVDARIKAVIRDVYKN